MAEAIFYFLLCAQRRTVGDAPQRVHIPALVQARRPRRVLPPAAAVHGGQVDLGPHGTDEHVRPRHERALVPRQAQERVQRPTGAVHQPAARRRGQGVPVVGERALGRIVTYHRAVQVRHLRPAHGRTGEDTHTYAAQHSTAQRSANTRLSHTRVWVGGLVFLFHTPRGGDTVPTRAHTRGGPRTSRHGTLGGRSTRSEACSL